MQTRRSDVLLHVCTHASYTTAQVVNMMRQLGVSPLPEVMLIALARQEMAGSKASGSGCCRASRLEPHRLLLTRALRAEYRLPPMSFLARVPARQQSRCDTGCRPVSCARISIQFAPGDRQAAAAADRKVDCA